MYNHARLDDPNIRDNAIIQLTTHGCVSLDPEFNRTFPVPEGMNVIFISAAAPGICNLMNTNTFNRIGERIRGLVPYMNNRLNLLTTTMSEDTINNVTEKFSEIAIELRNIDKQHTYEEITNKKITPIQTPYEKNYSNAFDRSYNVKFYKSGEQIFNKIYSRKDKEVDDLRFEINILSKLKNEKDLIIEDLMIELAHHRPDEVNTPNHLSRTTLEELINLLSSENIKNVVIFDLSCSNFACNGRPVSAKLVRSERRERLNQQTETELQNKTRKRQQEEDDFVRVRYPYTPYSAGKRFTRKNRKSRKPFRKSRKSRKPFRKSRKSRKPFRDVNNKK